MAKSVKALITPEVLKWARERRIRLEINYAAKKLSIKPERLEAWENGTEQPTFSQLKNIAKLYKTHISIFYLSEPPTDFQPLTDYRVLPEQLATDEEQVYRLNANIIEVFERRETLIELYELLEEPAPEVTLNVNKREDPGQAAQQITEFLESNRTQLQRANDPYAALKFWKQTVEAKGILVCQTSVNTHLSVALETVRGFCIAQNPVPVIVVNPKDSPYGRIFTLIHELVHIALGESVIQNTGFEEANPPNLDPIEVFCNQVAAEVLVPENELLEIVNLETLQEDLPGTSKFFHVSPEVIMRRLLILGIISRRNYQTYRSRQLAKYRDAPGRSGGAAPYPKDSPYGRIFTLIHELVHIALGESVIQNTGFEEANPPNLDPIEVFCNQVAAEVLVPENELLELVKFQTLEEELSRISKYFHVSSEVIMRRLLTLGIISRRNYQTYKSRQLAKYRNAPGRSGGAAPYHNRLLNTSGEHFARTAFTAYYEKKITRAELASVLSNCDTKHLAKIESAIFV